MACNSCNSCNRCYTTTGSQGIIFPDFVANSCCNPCCQDTTTTASGCGCTSCNCCTGCNSCTG